MTSQGGSPTHFTFKRHLARIVFLVSWFLAFIPWGKAEDVVVVVNPSVSYREISTNALRAIFGMRLRTWPNGEHITVYVMNDKSPVHTQFAKQQLSIFPHQLRLAWDRLVYSGTGQAPLEVDSEQEMRAKVAATTDAIGYLTVEMVDDSVRVLQVK